MGFSLRKRLFLSVVLAILGLPVALLLVSGSSAFGQENHDRPIPELSASLSGTRAGKLTPGDRARLLLDLALAYVHKQGEEKTDLDSALLLVREAQALDGIDGKAGLHDSSIEARSYYVSANALREKGDTAGGHSDIERSIRIYRGIQQYEQLGDAYMEGALYHSPNFDNTIADRMVYYKNALEAFRKAGLKEKQGFVLKNLADLDNINADYAVALGHLREALSIYLDIGYKDLQGVYDLMGNVSSSMADFPNAVKYGLLAVKTAQAVNDTTMQLCTICFRLSNSYENWSREKEALEYRQKAMSIAVKYENTEAILVILPPLTMLMERQGRWQEALQLVRHFDHSLTLNKTQRVLMYVSYIYASLAGQQNTEANRYSYELIHLIQEYSITTTLKTRTYSCLIHNFLQTSQYRQAEKYANLYIAYCKEIDYTKGKLDAYLLKSRADSGIGNFRSALVSHQAYAKLTDSVLNDIKSLQFAEMTIQYETEKKEADIKSKQENIDLLNDKALLREADLKKASLIRNIIILAALSLLVVLYTGYRFKQAHNTKLEAQQKEINGQNLLLKQLLTEQKQLVTDKEWLIQEIHHRIKNNLQIVISLLNAQSEFLDNPSALDAIRDSRERMQAIALIHQKLYQQDNSTAIQMESYIREMVTYMGNTFTYANRVSFRLDIGNIDLDVSQAVPLGLILNEAVTNAVKYAFPKDRNGIVTISLHEIREEEVELKITDDGQGLPEGLDIDSHESLGIQLMKLFSEQLEGDLHFRSRKGTGVQVSLVFRKYSPENVLPPFLKL